MFSRNIKFFQSLHNQSLNRYTTDTSRKFALSRVKKRQKLIFWSTLSSIVYFSYDANNNPNSRFLPFIKHYGFEKYFGEQFSEKLEPLYEPLYEPTTTKLLPDFPDDPIYGNVPPGTPAPPLLVLDVEKTLLGYDFDSKHGWRYIKRPGVDRFLQSLSQYYEIVLISETDIPDEVVVELDKNNTCHKLTQIDLENRDGVFLKRLDYMNRDIKKIILIDDDIETSSLFPRNTLLVPPFTKKLDDHILLDLIPLLQSLCHHGVSDFRDSFDDLGTHYAEEATMEYNRRLFQKKQEERMLRNKGIGGILRGQKKISGELVSSSEDIMGMSSTRSSTSVLDLVGPSPLPLTAEDSTPKETKKVQISSQKIEIGGNVISPPKEISINGQKKPGALLEWYNSENKKKAEMDQRKMEKMNEIYQKKMAEKHEREQKAKEEIERRKSFEGL